MTKIICFIPCIGKPYQDILDITIQRWMKIADTVVIVTDNMFPYRDASNIEFFVTSAFYEHGASMNIGAALSQAVAHYRDRMDKDTWILSVDADILPPADLDLRSFKLERGILYGCRRFVVSPDRIDATGELLSQSQIIGFFKLFHSRDWLDPVFEMWWTDAGNYDVMFARRYGKSIAWMPFDVKHIGETNKNWAGIGRAIDWENRHKRMTTWPRL